MHELDCLECIAYDRMRAVIPLITDRAATLNPNAPTHCIRGHEWTEASTRIDFHVFASRGRDTNPFISTRRVESATVALCF